MKKRIKTWKDLSKISKISTSESCKSLEAYIPKKLRSFIIKYVYFFTTDQLYHLLSQN